MCSSAIWNQLLKATFRPVLLEDLMYFGYAGKNDWQDAKKEKEEKT